MGVEELPFFCRRGLDGLRELRIKGDGVQNPEHFAKSLLDGPLQQY